MFKKITLSFLAIIMALSFLVPITAFAESVNYVPNTTFKPAWTYISSVTNNFNIDSSGKASMSSTIRTYSGSVTSVSMINYLQRYQNGSWINVQGWSYSNSGTNGNWGDSYYVLSGYTYRLLTYFYAYNGSTLLESTSGTSGTKAY